MSPEYNECGFKYEEKRQRVADSETEIQRILQAKDEAVAGNTYNEKIKK